MAGVVGVDDDEESEEDEDFVDEGEEEDEEYVFPPCFPLFLQFIFMQV